MTPKLKLTIPGESTVVHHLADLASVGRVTLAQADLRALEREVTRALAIPHRLLSRGPYRG